MERYKKTLQQKRTALLVIDIQEKIIKVINNHEKVIENTLKLIKGFKEMGLPVYYTEQYSRGLGRTVKELLVELDGVSAIEKSTFSCYGAGNLFNELSEKSLDQVVICGVEAHVCVQQTTLDLLENGFQVNLAADAVSSRREFDFKTAIDRMRFAGAEVTTTESVLFELLEICGTEVFKKISKLVK
jgi:isochorismate hydrolase